MDEKYLLDLLGEDHALFRLKYALELQELEMRERMRLYRPAIEKLIISEPLTGPQKEESKP